MRRLLVATTALAILLWGSGALAARRPRVTSKHKPKVTTKPISQPKRGVKGTAQLPGDNGTLGVTYTMGKGDNALNFTLLSAEYTTTRPAGKDPLVPKGDEKLLVLHYTVQNPNPRLTNLSRDSFDFTAVDSENTNLKGDWLVVKEETGEAYYMDLKPAQKVAVVAFIKVPAKSSVPKLMVARGSGNPVLRYFFDAQHPKNVIKGLAAPFADPADPTGATARLEVPAETGVYYPVGDFDVKLVGGAYVTDAIGMVRPYAKEQLYVATIMLKNATLGKRGYSRDTVGGELKTDDGDKATNDQLFKLRRDEGIYGDLDPGEEYSARLIFRIPKDAKATKLTLWEGNSHKYVFDVSALK